ncbi:hypothetical protein SAMN05216311_1202 [Chitinophaga sp. CF418]|nr:hypothetical protein SAMN05216311_1202 [Chitinophaga sp. CF418]
MRIMVLIFFLFITTNTIAQNTLGCKCDYSSSFTIEKYLFSIDSIFRKIDCKKGESVQVVGARGLAAASFVIIQKIGNTNKAYYYNLKTKDFKTMTGSKVNTWINSIIRDSSFMYAVKADPLKKPSHDFSFFVSFHYPYFKLKEVCYSELLSDVNRPFSEGLMESITLFNKRN